jgi:hypothetical protein
MRRPSACIAVTALVLLLAMTAHAKEPPYLAPGDIRPGANLSYSTDWQAVSQELAQTLASTGRFRLVGADKLQELLMTLPPPGDGAETDTPSGPAEGPASVAQRLEGTAARMTPEEQEEVAKLDETPGVVLDDAIARGTDALGQTGLGRVQGLAGQLGGVARGSATTKPKLKADLKLTVWLTDARTGVQLVRAVGYGTAADQNLQQAWKLALDEAVRGVLGSLVDIGGTILRMDPGGKARSGKPRGARIVVDLTRGDGLSPEQAADGDQTGVVLEIRQPDQDDPDIGLVKGELVGFALCCEAGDRGSRCAPFGLGNKVGPLKGKQLKEWWDAVQPGYVVKLRLDIPRCELPKPEEPSIPGAAAKDGVAADSTAGGDG